MGINVLTIIIGVFLIFMLLYGHNRGFVRMSISIVAMVVALLISNAVMPHVAQIIGNKTSIVSKLSESMQDVVHTNNITEEELEMKERQTPIIQGLELPEQIKQALIVNNNSEVYSMLNVDRFADYVGSYLAGFVINIIGVIVIFLIIFILLNLILSWMDILTSLPIISGVNDILGAVLGLLEGLIIVWISGLVITAISGTGAGMYLIRQISESPFLSFLYDNNMIIKMLIGILNGLA